MKIDREKVTPEILTEMRRTLATAGVDATKLSDDEVVERIERLLEVMIEFGKQLRAIMRPAVEFMAQFSQSQAAQNLTFLHSQAVDATRQRRC